MAQNVKKIISTLAGFALLFGQSGSAQSGVQEQAGAVYNSARMWVPLNYNSDLIFFADPFSVYKVDNSEWDINIAALNNQNQYVTEETKTYRINCNTLEVSPNVGWRVNGIIKENRGPLGVRSIRDSRFRANPTQIIWSAKEYVCGVVNSGIGYGWIFSSFRNGQIRGIIDRFWIKENSVDISPEDQNLRRAVVMSDVAGGNVFDFSDVYVKCDKREWMNFSKEGTLNSWAPVVERSAVDVIYEKMCSNRFQNIAYRTAPFEIPAPKPVPKNELVEKAESGSNMDDAKSKCSALGFRAGTPKFGQCVLKLTQ